MIIIYIETRTVEQDGNNGIDINDPTSPSWQLKFRRTQQGSWCIDNIPELKGFVVDKPSPYRESFFVVCVEDPIFSNNFRDLTVGDKYMLNRYRLKYTGSIPTTQPQSSQQPEVRPEPKPQANPKPDSSSSSSDEEKDESSNDEEDDSGSVNSLVKHVMNLEFVVISQLESGRLNKMILQYKH